MAVSWQFHGGFTVVLVTIVSFMWTVFGNIITVEMFYLPNFIMVKSAYWPLASLFMPCFLMFPYLKTAHLHLLQR